MKWKIHTGYLGPEQDIYGWGKDMITSMPDVLHVTESDISRDGLVAMVDEGRMPRDLALLEAYRDLKSAEFEAYMTENHGSVLPGEKYIREWIETSGLAGAFDEWSLKQGDYVIRKESPAEFRRRIMHELTMELALAVRENVIFIHGKDNRNLMVVIERSDRQEAMEAQYGQDG